MENAIEMRQWVELVQAVGKVAGIGGFALLVVCFLVRELLKKITLPTPTKNQAFVIVNGILLLAALALVLGIGAYCYQLYLQPKERNVELRIQKNDGTILAKPFTVAYLIPGRKVAWEKGEAGHATIVGIPADHRTFNVSDVSCAGYAMKDKPPFDILDAVVSIAMIESTSPPPWSKNELPNPVDDLPPEAEALSPPAVQPENVVFLYRNLSGDDLQLLLYDAAKHYTPNPNVAQFRARWYQLPCPASTEWQVFDRFDGGTGSFAIYVCDEKKNCQHLETKRIFQADTPRLTVTKDQSTAKYVQTFEFDTQE